MDQFEKKLKSIRQDFHRYPELGFQEKRTKTKIAAYLNNLGLDVHEGVGVVGILKSGESGRCVGLRADMDALPINEIGSHDHVSVTPGLMHACGHDGHITMLLGAAELLVKSKDFKGTIVFIFQPSEENGRGALAMIEEELLQRFPIDEIYGMHNFPGAPVGQISTRVGQICSSESLFEININGHGGHAAMPHVGVDAIIVGSEIVIALQTIIARKMSPNSGAVVSVTEFLTNGQRNTLPGRAVLKGEVRSREPSDRKALEKYLKQIVKGIAVAHGVTATVDFVTEFIETINAEVPTKAVIRASQELGLEINGNCKPMSFSEDFAHFSTSVPGCFLLIGNGKTGAFGRPLHSENYDFNDKLLSVGAKFWFALIQDRLPH